MKIFVSYILIQYVIFYYRRNSYFGNIIGDQIGMFQVSKTFYTILHSQLPLILDKYSTKNKHSISSSSQMDKFKWVIYKSLFQISFSPAFIFIVYDFKRRIVFNIENLDWDLEKENDPFFILNGNNICRRCSSLYAVQERVKCYDGNTPNSLLGLLRNILHVVSMILWKGYSQVIK